MNHLEQKYLQFLSSQLEGFRRVNKNANFRCPICGDSDVSKKKQRGWILTNKDHGRFYCHNCGASMPFLKLLKQLNYTLYKEYTVELLKEKGITKHIDNEPVTMPAPIFKEKTQADSFLKHCTPLTKLHTNHPALEYLQNRKVPSRSFDRLYWIDNLRDLKHFDKENKYDFTRIPEEGRILFPFFSSEGLIGINGRSIDPDNPKRYVIYKFDESKPSIFGTHDVYGKSLLDITKRVYVTEGPIDSLFLPNAIAVNGSDLPKVTKMVQKMDAVFIPDNEPRNKQIVAVYSKIIRAGCKICIFPSNIKEKDLNEMSLVYSSEYVKELIDENHYSGLSAKFKLSNWRKD